MKLLNIFLFSVLANLAFSAPLDLKRSDFTGEDVMPGLTRDITDCAVNSNDDVYLYSEGYQIVRFNGPDSIIPYIGLDFKNPSAFTLGNDTLFLGNVDGYVVKYYEGSFDTIARMPSNDIVYSLAMSPEGVLYADAPSSGTLKLVNDAWVRIDGDAWSNQMKFIDGVLWAAGANSISKLVNDQWVQFTGTPVEKINSDGDGGIIGSYSIALTLIDKNDNFSKVPLDLAVAASFVDENGFIWLGARDEPTIQIYDPIADSILITVDSLMGDASGVGAGIADFITDSNGKLYVCGQRWLWSYNGSLHQDPNSSDIVSPRIQKSQGLTLVSQSSHWTILGLRTQHLNSLQVVTVTGAQQRVDYQIDSDGVLKLSREGLPKGSLYLKLVSENNQTVFPINN